MLEKWPEPVKWPDQISRFYDYIIKMCVLIAQLLTMEPREEKTFLLDHQQLQTMEVGIKVISCQAEQCRKSGQKGQN